MAINDITLAIGFAAWTFPPGIGVAMLMSTPPRIIAARKLFWLSLPGPIVAQIVWVVASAPSFWEVFVGSGIIGGTVCATLVELLYWQECENEKTVAEPHSDKPI